MRDNIGVLPASRARLLADLFEDQTHPLRASMEVWLTASRRYFNFVTLNQPKIRKKLRTPRDAESQRDVLLELETAFLLLQVADLNVDYEAQRKPDTRSPDFEVRYTTSMTFMLEVTRLRKTNLVDAVCGKLGQMQPGCANVIVVALDGPLPTVDDPSTILRTIQQRAEAGDRAIVDRHGFRGRADVLNHLSRLSALLLRRVPLPANMPVTLLANPQARHPLPTRVMTALAQSHCVHV